MPYLIDAHQDLAYNALTFQRDYLRPVAETRRLERNTLTPQRNGHTLLGWPEYQNGQVAALFGVMFLTPRRYQAGEWETQVYTEPADARPLYEKQYSYYRGLAEDHPDRFRIIYNQADLQEVLDPWEKSPAYLSKKAVAALANAGRENTPEAPDPREVVNSAEEEEELRPPVTHPVGIVLLMEGLGGIRAPEEMEEWWERGVRIAGPVWAGTRFCGGMHEPGEFTREGLALLEVLAGLGFTLDISHMNEASALQALDRYEGPVIATHANARALLRDTANHLGERHLSDLVIRRLIERDGVIGVVPFNKFLRADWTRGDDRRRVTLRTLAAHIDHICQLAGDALHVGLGTDFDGGFGWPDVPYEIDTIADLQKLAPVLGEYGYTEDSIRRILGGNWRSHLERNLPAK